MVASKNTDSKGRLTLGEAFANRTVLVSQVSETEIRVTLARVVPEDEMWLYENKKALASLRRGLKQARAGRLSKGPDMVAARKLAEQLED